GGIRCCRTFVPARAPRALRAPTSWCGARLPDAPQRRPTDQTSTLESPANGSRWMQSGRSERQHRPASQLPHECRSAGRTMDATDTAAPETRYCGRSQALLYNTIRPHASMGCKPRATFPQLHTLCVVGILQTTPRGFSRSHTKGNVSIETVVEQDPRQNEVCPKETRWRPIDLAPHCETSAELDR